MHAQDIVLELHATLRSTPGTAAPALASLYDYLLRQLVAANVHKDHETAKHCLGLVNDLRDTWRQAAGSLVAERVTPATIDERSPDRRAVARHAPSTGRRALDRLELDLMRGRAAAHHDGSRPTLESWDEPDARRPDARRPLRPGPGAPVAPGAACRRAHRSGSARSAASTPSPTGWTGPRRRGRSDRPVYLDIDA